MFVGRGTGPEDGGYLAAMTEVVQRLGDGLLGLSIHCRIMAQACRLWLGRWSGGNG
jgi:hypothetical protein